MATAETRRSTASCLTTACLAALVSFLALGPTTPDAEAAPCDPPVANEIVCENSKPGSPAIEWDVTGAGDPAIQGFATDISVDQGQTVRFKVDTTTNDYRLDIYRLGYYGGDGARKVATVQPSVTLPQLQPDCLADTETGLIDCGNWAESASWSVPADAVSGIYLARLVREDSSGGASHIAFIVRDDDGNSDLLFQTSDTTWQAYNTYGGNSLYGGSTGNPGGRAQKVSYNRPFITRGNSTEDWLFNSEYPMLRWLERNGYDVSYFTDVDTDRLGAELLEHDAFLSVGHDEYWSAGQRGSVEAARAAGVHLGFFSGNEIYWKVRWEPSADGANTPYRTLVTYKEGTLGELACGSKCDPETNVWTGLWRDGCSFSPPADGCRPENALSGQISWIGSTTSMEVPAADGKLRFWRNTSIASLPAGQTATLPDGVLGYEWNFEQYHTFYPAGRFWLSSTTRDGSTHHLSLYRHSSGSLVFGAGTVQWMWGLDSTHDRGAAPVDARMQQATVNLLADMGVQPATLQSDLNAATASTDAAAPASSISSPADGSNVESGTPTTITGTASDSGGGVVAAVEISVDGGTTWQRASGRENWSFAWTPGGLGEVTIKSRAVDDSGRVETPSGGVTVTVAGKTCPCSIWGSSATPGTPASSDANAVELGVKFRSDVDGSITGLRFYKGSTNTGTHVGRLWSSAGAKLAEASFTGESASGWQEVTLDSPVAITKDTTYIASYHTTTGHYAFDGGYFASSGVDSVPLHALQNGVDGGNGVYVYGPLGNAAPSSTFNASNYWVDVVFATDVGQDTTPPIVSSRSPASGAAGVATTANVTVSFNEAVDASTVDGSTFELRDSANGVVPATVGYNAGTRTATLDPTSELANSATYTATVKGGDAGVKDAAGNALAVDQSWSFTTAAPPPPPPDEGPGGPVLVISKASNPFTRYYAEILRNEGLNAFTVKDVSTVDAATLDQYDVAILGEMTLSAAQVAMLGEWVAAGGNLIAMRPDLQLAELLGLTDGGSTLSNAYLQIDTTSGPGKGIVGETIQFHGDADRYLLNGASSVATLYSTATTATPNPAVTLRSVGSQGGQVAAFTFDLARSVVYTRQGNPAWAGQERDGVGPIRSDDMFFGGSEPDWVDLSKVAIPQADEQQRLLVNLIGQMNADRKPLPRFWYFPRGEKAAVVMTGDDHGSGGTPARFDTYKAQSPPGCSVADWECVRASSYIYSGTPGMTDAASAAYHADGFEVGLHVDTGCANWTPESLESFYAGQLSAWSAERPSIPMPSTNRTHCIAWSDWATQPKVELAHGIRLDTNYYYWPPGWVQDRPGMFTGSGMPMRFADLDGTMIDVYQAVTQMTDESGQSYPATSNALLDRAVGPEGYYGAFTANMHTDSASHGGSDAIVASALARGVPVVSGRQMLSWLDGRNGSSFGSLSWSGNTLSFTIAVGAGANGLQAMVPTQSAVGALTGITRNGSPVFTTNETIKGVEYAFFGAAAGNYGATYAVDTTPPTVSSVNASPATDGTATVAWTTNEASDSRVDYGTGTGSLTESVTDAASVTSHSVTLTGLAPNTTYYFRVTSRDSAGNQATSPPSADPPASFTTPSAALVDTTAADFSAGTPGTDTYVAETGNGEVTLRPTAGGEFSGSSVPSGWKTFAWSAGGTAVVGGGVLTLDGSRAVTDDLYPRDDGHSVEFVATLAAAPNQHAGFAGGNDQETFSTAPWAIFSTGSGGTGLFARTNTGAGVLDEAIPGNWLGAPHRYRVDWLPAIGAQAAKVVFSIDGNVVATHTVDISGQMRPAASDISNGGGSLALDWMRMTPYPTSGTLTSRVLDAGQAVNWASLSWTAATPAGTSLALQVRQGNTPTPDGSWTGFVPLSTPGAAIGGNSRYLQYRAELGSTDLGQTPVLEDVSVSYTLGEDTTAPTIADRSPSPDATGVAVDANVTVQFSEPMDGASVNGNTVQLRDASNAIVPASVTYGAAASTLDPTDALAAGHTYMVTVKGGTEGVKDAAGNPLAADATWSFTTAVSSLTDTTVAEFSAGTPGSDTYVAETANGEVVLAPAAGAEFGGTALPSGWSATLWSAAGSASVGGGSLVVDGARVGTDAVFAPGRSLEFVATFAPGSLSQHVGFGTDFNSFPFAIFSTKDGSGLYARTNSTETAIAGIDASVAHRYRVDWTASSFVYSIDGSVVATHDVAVGENMRPLISDFHPGGGAVSVNWIRMTPYSGSGSFLSRVLDAGAAVDWGNLLWSADTPSGTGVALEVRTGNTPTPDGTWSDFAPVASSGSSVGANSRYLQYRAALTTSAPGETPVLKDVSVQFAADETAPTIASRTPAANATDVALGTDVTVEFSEPMDASSINGSSVRLRAQGGGTDVPAAVSYVGQTATLNPDADLAPGTVYQMTVAGTVEDAGGNQLGGDATWTFTTGDRACPCSLWDDSTTPADEAFEADTNAVELGLKFQLSSSGYIMGVRFYKGTTNTGTHVGHLWTSTGTLLATATFADETAFGWQQVSFGSPVAVDANTVYVASYHAPAGNYAFSAGNWPFTNPPLQALGAAYTYGESGSFPANASSGNYWVDVVFVKALPADTTAPVITSRSPAPDAPDVALGTDVTVEFSEPMDVSSINGSSVRLRAQGAGADVPAAVSYADQTATLNPDADLEANTVYDVTIAESVSDVAGNELSSDATWSFTTIAPALGDTTVADFTAGTLGSCATVAHTGNGEVTLEPAVGEEFAGPTLPAGWKSFAWPGGGVATVGGGVVTIDGARLVTDNLYARESGRSLEFVASFASSSPFQHVGFGGGNDEAPGETFSTSPWAMFSTGSGGTTLQARTWAGGLMTDQDIPGSWFGAPHRYRIDWLPALGDQPAKVVYSIDGNVVATHNVDVSGEMRPAASDFFSGGGAVSVDWMRMSPYASSCTFTSRAFDAGGLADWSELAATTVIPTGTSITYETRSGNTATPDTSWSDWAGVSGQTIASPNRRYMQYRAVLATTDPTNTPELRDVTISFAAAVNQAPLAAADSYSVAEDGLLGVAAPGALANDTDPDGDPLSAALVEAPAHGVLSLAADGSFSYTPEANFHGSDSFSYRASDGSLESALAQATITVTPVNDAPLTLDDEADVAEDSTDNAIAVLANDSPGPANEAAQALALDAITQAPAHGSAALGTGPNAGTILYTPPANFSGEDSLRYRACDDGSPSECATALVTITIAGANDTPLAQDDVYSLHEDEALTFAAPGVLANDSDADGDTLTASLLDGPGKGTLTLEADGSFSYTPHANANGSDNFSYRASDGSASSQATVTLTITAVNDAPIAADDSATTATNTATDISVLLNDSDVEGDALSVDSFSQGSNGVVIRSGNGLRYIPNAGFTGTDTFTYRAEDGTLPSDSATVTVKVEQAAAAGIAFRGASSARNNDTQTLRIPVPPGLVRGDFMLATITVRSGARITPPAGWQLVRSSANSSMTQATYYRFVGSATPGSYTWTLSPARGASGGIVAYSGVDREDPIDAAGGQSNDSSKSITTPSITTTVPNTMLVGLFGIAADATVEPPSGMAERVEVVNLPTAVTTEIADALQASVGRTGRRIATASSAARNAGHLIALTPDHADPPDDDD